MMLLGLLGPFVRRLGPGCCPPSLRGGSAAASLVAAALAFTTTAAIAAAAAGGGGGAIPPLFHSPLVTPEQVRGSMEASKGGPRIRFIDSSWHLDKSRDPRKEFVEEHIKGAAFFDIDAVADKTTNLPHMLPSADEFSSACRSLGLLNQDAIVVYTTRACFSAARGWWTFKAFGHEQLLDVVESSAIAKGQAQVVDARGAPRFNAEVDEPRPGLARGRIPGSRNVPFNLVLAEGDWTRFRPPQEIAQVFAKAGVTLSSSSSKDPPPPIITSCGSGVTGAVLSLAMVLASGRDVGSVPVYDGSWAEWGGRPDLPKDTTPPNPGSSKEEL